MRVPAADLCRRLTDTALALKAKCDELTAENARLERELNDEKRILKEAEARIEVLERPTVLSGHQIKTLLSFVAPDLPDLITSEPSLSEDVQFQLGCEMSIMYYEHDRKEDGDDMPAGYYAWFTEYPDEGSIFLGQALTTKQGEQEQNDV